MKQQVKIYTIKGNPKNPRIIKNDKFKTLKHSIRTMPGYMKLRPVIIDEDMMVLGGNMRLKASIDLGKKEIWTDMFTQADCDDMNKIAIEEERETKTYLEYCDAIIIKDNVTSGEWEWDILANEWDSVLLKEYGLDVWQNEDDIKEIQNPENKESENPFATELDRESNYIVLKFDTDIDWLQAKTLFDLKTEVARRSNGKAWSSGIGRVLNGVDAINKIKNES
jgi:hypothetical protein